MKTLNTLEEATAHFNESVATVMLQKEDGQPQEANNLEEARAYFGFTPPVDEPGNTSSQDKAVSTDGSPAEITGDIDGGASPLSNIKDAIASSENLE